MPCYFERRYILEKLNELEVSLNKITLEKNQSTQTVMAKVCLDKIASWYTEMMEAEDNKVVNGHVEELDSLDEIRQSELEDLEEGLNDFLKLYLKDELDANDGSPDILKIPSNIFLEDVSGRRFIILENHDFNSMHYWENYFIIDLGL